MLIERLLCAQAALILFGPPGAPAAQSHLQPLDHGAIERGAGAQPVRLNLSVTPAPGLQHIPDQAAQAEFTQMELGPHESPTRIAVAADGLDGDAPHMWVDANNNGDLTDDPPVALKSETYKDSHGHAFTKLYGDARVEVRYGSRTLPVGVRLFRYDPADAERALYRGALLFILDSGYAGTVTLGGQTYPALLYDATGRADYRGRPGGVLLMIDRNGNGSFDARGELYDTSRPFTVNGTTWQVSGVDASGEQFAIAESKEHVPEIAPPPDLRAGHAAPPFHASDLNGGSIDFPADFAGHPTLVVFYASWCSDCQAEMPHLVTTVAKYRTAGLRVVGISLDKPDAKDGLVAFARSAGIWWPQVYDGGFWNAAVANQYFVHAIPSALLVDGSGKVLRFLDDEHIGPDLDGALASALSVPIRSSSPR